MHAPRGSWLVVGSCALAWGVGSLSLPISARFVCAALRVWSLFVPRVVLVAKRGRSPNANVRLSRYKNFSSKTGRFLLLATCKSELRGSEFFFVVLFWNNTEAP